MQLETLRGCGKLGIEFTKKDSEGARVSKKFLEQLVTNIVKRSVSYYKKTNDHPFYYSEKQLNSVVCPAIADITPSYLMEYSLKRKPVGEEEFSGRADYWIYYKDYAFLMELKHEYCAYNSVNPPRASIFNAFDDALQKLKMIRKDECRLCATGTNNLIKIAFEAIVFYGGSKIKNKRKAWKSKNFEQVFKDLLENSGLNKVANMTALWVLDESLVEPYDFDKGYFEVYPAVAFVGHISEGQT